MRFVWYLGLILSISMLSFGPLPDGTQIIYARILGQSALILMCSLVISSLLFMNQVWSRTGEEKPDFSNDMKYIKLYICGYISILKLTVDILVKIDILKYHLLKSVKHKISSFGWFSLDKVVVYPSVFWWPW